MKKLVKRLRSRRGETLVESMAGILIFTLASIILLTMISTAARLNQTAKEFDQAIETELLSAERKDTAAPGSYKVTFSVGGTEIDEAEVTLFRADEDSLYSYSLR